MSGISSFSVVYCSRLYSMYDQNSVNYIHKKTYGQSSAVNSFALSPAQLSRCKLGDASPPGKSSLHLSKVLIPIPYSSAIDANEYLMQ